MKTQYVIVETDQSTGELRIGFQSNDRVVLMADFLIFGTGTKQRKITNKFHLISMAKLAIKRLEKHHQQIEELI